jgi:hypothetical protein
MRGPTWNIKEGEPVNHISYQNILKQRGNSAF